MRKKDKVELWIIWGAVFIAGFTLLYMYYRWTQPVYQVHNSICSISKCQEDLPDPERAYFDSHGNKRDASGNVIELAPLSGGNVTKPPMMVGK